MGKDLERKRPFGVTALAVCFFIGGVPGLFIGLLFGISGPPPLDSYLDVVLDTVTRLVAILSPVLFVLSGVGLLKLKTWARWMAMILSPALAFIFLGGSGLFLEAIFPSDAVSANPAFAAIKWGPFFVAGIVILYLSRPKVKAQFK